MDAIWISQLNLQLRGVWFLQSKDASDKHQKSSFVRYSDDARSRFLKRFTLPNLEFNNPTIRPPNEAPHRTFVYVNRNHNISTSVMNFRTFNTARTEQESKTFQNCTNMLLEWPVYIFPYIANREAIHVQGTFGAFHHFWIKMISPSKELTDYGRDCAGQLNFELRYC